MSTTRRLSVALLLLTACAGWEPAAPSNAPPPADSPTPSHYAPPPPVDPREPSTAPAPEGSVQVAIASVQLVEDCPDPAAAGKPTVQGPDAGVALPNGRSSMKQPAGAQMRGQSADGVYTSPCTQSMVQMSVRADFAGSFKIEAVRVLAGAGKQVAGTATLRGPTAWTEANGTYAPWDGRTVAGQELKISYKLGDPDFSQAAARGGAGDVPVGAFGPYVLEVDVSVDGRRQTIRSSEFTREPPHVMVT